MRSYVIRKRWNSSWGTYWAVVYRDQWGSKEIERYEKREHAIEARNWWNSPAMPEYDAA